jgi:hypothetical protein
MFKAWPAFLAVLLAFSLAIPVCAYDAPLAENSIRDAYFLGTRTGGLSPDFIVQYARLVPVLKQGGCASNVRIETPFLEVAKHAREAPNYSAQDAVQEFYGKAMIFRMYLDICYEPNAPPNAVKLEITQNKKQLVPLSSESTAYAQATDFGYLPPNGEQIVLEFASEKIASATLTVLIDTPDGQHGETEFDLQKLR